MMPRSPRLQTCIARFVRNTHGVAAIETAFVLPILLMLFIGMIDFTNLVNNNRKMTQATSLVADIIGQQKNTIKKSQIDDIFLAVDMIMAAGTTVDAQVHVDGYRVAGSTVTKIWSASRGSCYAPVSTATLANLMTQGNDVVVATICSHFEPWVGQILGKSVLGAVSFDMNEVITVRPRASLQITCMTDATPSTVCPPTAG